MIDIRRLRRAADVLAILLINWRVGREPLCVCGYRCRTIWAGWLAGICGENAKGAPAPVWSHNNSVVRAPASADIDRDVNFAFVVCWRSFRVGPRTTTKYSLELKINHPPPAPAPVAHPRGASAGKQIQAHRA